MKQRGSWLDCVSCCGNFDFTSCNAPGKHASDALTRIRKLKKKALEDELVVLTISQELFACAAKAGKVYFKITEERKSRYVSFILKVYMMADVRDNEKS